MKYTYLIINILTIFFPVALSFDKRVQFYKSWKYLLPAMLITGLIFLFWDVLFTIKGVWSFNERYITGIKFLQLPVEEILFFLTVPFACVFIYACLNYYIKWQIGKIAGWVISGVLIVLSLTALIFHHHLLYTTVTFGLLLLLLVFLLYASRVNWLNRFYLAFLVSLIPFYIVNGILTSLPVVMYNNGQNLGVRVGTIPLEDHFYSMSLLLMNVALFEYFKGRQSLIK